MVMKCVDIYHRLDVINKGKQLRVYLMLFQRHNREVKISLRQRQRVRERNFCVLTSSFRVFFLVVYKNVTKTTAVIHCRSRTRCRALS